MRLSTLLAAAAASSLLVSPALANPAAPLSLANATGVKASTPARKANALAGGAIAGVIGALILTVGIVAAATGDDGGDSN